LIAKDIFSSLYYYVQLVTYPIFSLFHVQTSKEEGGSGVASYPCSFSPVRGNEPGYKARSGECSTSLHHRLLIFGFSAEAKQLLLLF